MPAPISQFGYQKTGNEVTFTSLSLNINPSTTYLWDFGDGVTSNVIDPVHDFINAGFYNVSLTVTNLEGTNTSNNLINLGNQNNPQVFNDIPKIIDLYSPTEIIGTIRNHSQKEFLIAKWQCYLQPLLFEPEVSIEDTYNASSYPPLVNSLLAKLVVIDIIEMETTTFLLKTATDAGGGGTSTGTDSTTSSSQGGIKSIETGPTKVERYENKDSSSQSERAANLAKTYASLTDRGGILEQLKASACQEAQRISVYLPMCGPLPSTNRGIKVTSKCNKNGYNANPFGITERMT